MNQAKPQLLAAYWTLAGDVYPGSPTEVSPFSLQDRAKAAYEAGWRGLGLLHADLMANAETMGLQGIKRVLNDNGIEHVEVEFLCDWFLDPKDPRRKDSDRMRHELIECAAVLGARNLKCAPQLFIDGATVIPPDVPRIAEEFVRLCEQARPAGVNIAIEMMPFTNLPTIDATLDMLTRADQPNGGFMLDVWHVFRGGMTAADIAKIPKRFLKGIELNDADATPVGQLFDDSRFNRRLCGEGSFDLTGFVNAVVATGFDAPYYGVELISKEIRKLPLDVMARTTYETTMRTVEAARA
jgi:sugar phosphate isomerase/epimerase